MKFFVYILYSEKVKRYYIGHTQNLERRLIEHNSGQNKSTKYGIPWKHVFTKEFSSRSEAMKYEIKIKRMKSKKFIENLILTPVARPDSQSGRP